MSDRHHLIPAVYVLLRRTRNEHEEVLLQLREGTGFMDGFWAHAAAGHVERGESVVDAAVREAAEELGVEISPSELMPLTVVHRRHESGLQPDDHRVDFFFECRNWKGQPHLMEPDKAAELQWWPLDDLPGALVEHEAFVLEHRHADTLSPIHTTGF